MQPALETGLLDHGGVMGVALKKGDTQDIDLRVQRIPYRVQIVVRPRESGGRHEAEARDLSMGGMFIKTEQPLESGTVFDIEIPMNPLSFRGAVRVLWTRLDEAGTDQPNGMGVEWVDMSTSQKMKLFRQIDDHIRAGGELIGGKPDVPGEAPAASRKLFDSAAETPDYPRLILRLSIAVVLVLIALLVLLLP